MKDPNHAAYLPELMQQFPDAKFLIFTHRSPAQIVPSMAKLFLCFTSVQHIPGARGTTSEEWGQEVVLRMQHYCQGLVNFAEANKGKQHSTAWESIQRGESIFNFTSWPKIFPVPFERFTRAFTRAHRGLPPRQRQPFPSIWRKMNATNEAINGEVSRTFIWLRTTWRFRTIATCF